MRRRLPALSIAAALPMARRGSPQFLSAIPPTACREPNARTTPCIDSGHRCLEPRSG